MVGGGTFVGRWRATAATLVVGTLGGALLAKGAFPLAWLLGSLAMVWLAVALGMTGRVPRGLRNGALGILGILVGQAMGADLWAQPQALALSLMTLPLYLLIVVTLGFIALRRWTSLGVAEAYFGAVPGGMGQMTALGEDAGGRVRTLTLIHSTRILLIITLLPGLFAAGTPPANSGLGGGLGVAALAMVMVSLLGAPLASWLHLPTPWLVGPMLLSSVLHAADLTDAIAPEGVVIAAQIVIGANLGLAFPGLTRREFGHTVLVAAGLTALMLLLCVLWAAGLWLLLPERPWRDLALAYAPGGVGEIGLIAAAVGADVAFVSSHHLVRLLLIYCAVALGYQWVAGRAKGPR